jgi:putative transposase
LRRHLVHDITSWLVSNCDRLVIEDLNVTGMMRLRALAKALSDAGFGDVRRLFTYKASWYGCDLVVADRWFASSKTCSTCGHVKDTLSLSERMYHCDMCGLVLDRDVNAAVNLARWGLTETVLEALAPTESPPLIPA